MIERKGSEKMLALKGVYEEGKIRLLEPVNAAISADLYITVVPHGSDQKAAGYESPKVQSKSQVMEAGGSWEEDAASATHATPMAYTPVLRKTVQPDPDGYIHVKSPPGFGSLVEVIVMPLSEEIESDCFECTDADGITYKVNNWTDEEFYQASMIGACGDDDTRAEDLFDV